VGLTIKQISIAEELESAALIAEYAAECSIPMIGQINPQAELYATLERVGVLKCFGLFDGDRLVGFANVLTTVLPHYGKKVATVESLFVASANRSGTAGKELLEAIEGYAKDAGCAVVFYSAPSGGRLEKVLLGKKNYSRTNAIFCRSML
jgi:GNAT superfamily N-acetyltransferase